MIRKGKFRNSLKEQTKKALSVGNSWQKDRNSVVVWHALSVRPKKG